MSVAVPSCWLDKIDRKCAVRRVRYAGVISTSLVVFVPVSISAITVICATGTEAMTLACPLTSSGLSYLNGTFITAPQRDDLLENLKVLKHALPSDIVKTKSMKVSVR